jgi:xylan 1,4-beta-xylosidase
MRIRKAVLTIVSVLCAVAPISAQVIQGAGESPAGTQPQKAARYVNPLTVEDAGRLADPVVIRIQGKYYLYATGGLAWSSDDLVHWDYHQVKMPEGGNIAAPGVFAYQGYVYITGNYTGLFRSRDPLGPFEYFGDFMDENGQRLERGLSNGWGNGGVFDPMIFVDEDDRLYLYYAGRSINGIYGVELDPTDPKNFLGPVEHFFRFETSHIWERYGNRNEYSGVSWIEGPWMTKRNGTYYLQYAAPGTDWTTYAVGVYTGKNPLGPFTYYEGSPILVHRGGLINGCGHHSVVEGPDGTVWAFYTLLYRNWNRMFERRIGMDPVGFDEQGNMLINSPSETPQWAPGIKANPELGNDSMAIQLSEDKSYTVSSEAPGRNAPYAFDNNARTWWAPTVKGAEPWLILDLSSATEADPIQEYIVDSARILFTLPAGLSTEDAEPRIRQYKIEVSSDGETFTTAVDKSKNDTDNAVEFDEVAPIKCRYVKLTITGWPKDLPCGVLEFTVFGKPGLSYPPR